MVDDVGDAVKSSKLHMYADDLKLREYAYDVEDRDGLQRDAEAISQWSKVNNLYRDVKKMHGGVLNSQECGNHFSAPCAAGGDNNSGRDYSPAISLSTATCENHRRCISNDWFYFDTSRTPEGLGPFQGSLKSMHA